MFNVKKSIFIFVLIQVGYILTFDCDYEFGDPKWNYLKVFHNTTHDIPAGVKSYLVDFSSETDKMIGYICVNLQDYNPKQAEAAFQSLFNKLYIYFDKPTTHTVSAHVLAMHHAIGTLLTEADGYVLVQVRKGENKSDVDALIHKVVPSHKFEEIAETARKQFKNFKQYKIKSKPGDNELESIVFALKTDDMKDTRRRNDAKGDLKNLWEKIRNFFKGIFRSNNIPNYRSKLQRYNIKPEIIQFKNSNGKPSMMFEVNAKSILRTIKDFLSSKNLKTYTDTIVNKAAVVYRTFKEELGEE